MGKLQDGEQEKRSQFVKFNMHMDIKKILKLNIHFSVDSTKQKKELMLK